MNIYKTIQKCYLIIKNIIILLMNIYKTIQKMLINNKKVN